MSPKTSPIVQRAVEAVRNRISEKGWAPGSPLPSEIFLASDLGVSRGTVRRAIDALVATGELERRPHARPRIGGGYSSATPTAARDVMAWISRPLADESALLFLRGLSRGLAGSQYRLAVREPSRFTGDVVNADERQFFLDLIQNPNVAGAVVEREPFAQNNDVIRRLAVTGCPLVFVDVAPPAGITADFVGTSNVSAAQVCTEHLLDLGHSRIAFLCDTDMPRPIVDRRRGYLRAMELAGVKELGRVLTACYLPPAEDHGRVVGGEYARAVRMGPYFSDFAARLVRAVLESEPRPTALFVCHDILAYHVCGRLEGLGIRVPEDISVVGFDWLARDGRLPDSLTTAAQDFEGFGRHAVHLLLDRLTGDAPELSRHVLLDAPLVIRSSTASELVLPVTSPANRLAGEVARL